MIVQIANTMVFIVGAGYHSNKYDQPSMIEAKQKQT